MAVGDFDDDMRPEIAIRDFGLVNPRSRIVFVDLTD